MTLGKSSNISIVMSDDDGLFIRYGTMKFRPQNVSDAGSLRRGATCRAWPADHSKSALKVDTGRGERNWPRA